MLSQPQTAGAIWDIGSARACDAKPSRVAQPSLPQLHALIDGWACAASSKLCGLSKPRAVIISVRHPGAWLASITKSCPDCPSAIPGRKEGAVRRRPEFYVRTWNFFYRAWVSYADNHEGHSITFVRNEDVQRDCRRAARDLVEQLNLDWRPSESLPIACDSTNSGPAAVQDLREAARTYASRPRRVSRDVDATVTGATTGPLWPPMRRKTAEKLPS